MPRSQELQVCQHTRYGNPVGWPVWREKSVVQRVCEREAGLAGALLAGRERLFYNRENASSSATSLKPASDVTEFEKPVWVFRCSDSH